VQDVRCSTARARYLKFGARPLILMLFSVGRSSRRHLLDFRVAHNDAAPHCDTSVCAAGYPVSIAIEGMVLLRWRTGLAGPLLVSVRLPRSTRVRHATCQSIIRAWG
jgi:hypothetical protein